MIKKMQHDTTQSYELPSKGSIVSANCTKLGEVARQLRVSMSERKNTWRASRSNTKSGVVGRWESGEECHWCSQLGAQVGVGKRGGAQGGGTTLLKAVFEGREYEGERCGARLGRVMRKKCEVTLEVDESMPNGTQGERNGSDG